ncbi:hypothetical protein TWF217_009579 [Orbilia oligospora]|nr:hypothetical protein TWF751_002536 [Orbilia oligospora]KAF3247782.1 hypothetical protein TWF217_009579 [Orbilia oligospora]
MYTCELSLRPRQSKEPDRERLTRIELWLGEKKKNSVGVRGTLQFSQSSADNIEHHLSRSLSPRPFCRM